MSVISNHSDLRASNDSLFLPKADHSGISRRHYQSTSVMGQSKRQQEKNSGMMERSLRRKKKLKQRGNMDQLFANEEKTACFNCGDCSTTEKTFERARSRQCDASETRFRRLKHEM